MSRKRPPAPQRLEPIRTWPDVVPDERHTLGWAALQWAADYLLQPDGPNAGQPWRFTMEQVKILLRWYEINDNGRFVRRRGTIRKLKGWGKSPFTAAMSGIELCGPCRFGGWDSKGMPVVIRHSAPWIQIAAVNQDQTRNTMTVFPGLFSKKAVEEYKLDIGKLIIYSEKGSGRIEAVTSSPRALEGGRPSLVIADETQHWLQSNEGHAMSAAIRRNLAKSRDGSAREIEITNAHMVDEGSVAEQSYEAWRQLDGKITDIYYDATEATPILYHDEDGDHHLPLAQWTDDQIREALISARGDSTWVDIERLLKEIRDPTTTESLARRYYLNQIWSADAGQAWLPEGAWDACSTGKPVEPGSYVMLAVDGSYNDDSTGITVSTIGDRPHLDVVDVWEKPVDSNEDWTVPIPEVEDKIREACKTYRVNELVFDPYRWARTMQVLQAEGLHVVEFPQSPERMITATQRFQTAVVNRTLTHSGDPRLRRHIENVAIKENSRGIRIAKETKWSPRKIDLAVAAVMAHDPAAAQPGQGAGWLEYMKQEIAREQGSQQAAELGLEIDGHTIRKAPDEPAPATKPSDYFGEERKSAPVPSTCQHRWGPDGFCLYCGSLRCPKCGQPYARGDKHECRVPEA